MERIAIVLAVFCIAVGLHALTHPPVRHEGRVADYAPRTLWPSALSRLVEPGQWVTLAGVPDLSAAENHRTGQSWDDGERILVPLVPEGTTAATARRVVLLIVRDLRKDQSRTFHHTYRLAEKEGRLASLAMPVPAGPGRFSGMACRAPLPAHCMAQNFGIQKDAIVTLLDPEGGPPSSFIAWTFVELGALILAGILLLPLAVRQFVPHDRISGRILERHRMHRFSTSVMFLGWTVCVGSATVALLEHDPAMLFVAGPIEALGAAIIASALLGVLYFASQHIVLTEEGIGFVHTLLGSTQFVRWRDVQGFSLPIFARGRVLGALLVETAERTMVHLVHFTVADFTRRTIRQALAGPLAAELLKRIRNGECVAVGRTMATDRDLWVPAIDAPHPVSRARGAFLGGFARVPWSHVVAVVGTEWALELHVRDCVKPVRLSAFRYRNALALPEIVCAQVRAANPDARVELAKG